MKKHPIATPDPWQALRQQSAARIALGRAGGSLPTAQWLDFKMAHAAARDAVHDALETQSLRAAYDSLDLPSHVVATAAADRQAYLLRPDLGRRLDAPSREQLARHGVADGACDLSLIVSDGLSAQAVHNHALPLLQVLVPRLKSEEWSLAPLVLAPLGRVALQDEIGYLLGARIALILIGERPGLGAPDSLGAYLVHDPHLGKTDANRNCVSNIRQGGLTYDSAADTLMYLLNESRRRQISGVQLKDNRPSGDSPLLE